ncbi:MAG: histidine phosphatase family protein [Lentisphaeria bacterium]|nr:histidine phosphatase family protein [Lentisphaeria bacterium]
MKKITLVLLLLAFGGFALHARKIYVTRHAQVGDKDIKHPSAGEYMITPLGKKQAALLADYLVNKEKFNGTILVSPFYRTIETGIAVADKLGKKVYLEPGIQEIAPRGKGRFMKGKEIAEYFSGKAVPGKAFNDQWRLSNEDSNARQERVNKAIDRILEENEGDLLLVSHGGTCSGIVRAFNAKAVSGAKPVKGMPWNCSLFIFELNDQDQVVNGAYTTEYMSDDIVTNNFRVPKVPKRDDPRYEMPEKR